MRSAKPRDVRGIILASNESTSISNSIKEKIAAGLQEEIKRSRDKNAILVAMTSEEEEKEKSHASEDYEEEQLMKLKNSTYIDQ